MKQPMTAKQRRMKRMVKYLQDYMNTYSNQMCYLDYEDDTLIHDVVYGLGVALNKKRYQYSDGYKRFRKFLIEKIKDKDETQNSN